MFNLNWSRKELTNQKVGTFGEYLAKMALASYGVSIYSPEVDDHGIDFVAEVKKGFLKFQVKTIRNSNTTVNLDKKKFDVSDQYLYIVLVILIDGKLPELYFIPATTWNEKRESKTFVYRLYKNKSSSPEYGINPSVHNKPELEQYKLENMIKTMI